MPGYDIVGADEIIGDDYLDGDDYAYDVEALLGAPWGPLGRMRKGGLSRMVRPSHRATASRSLQQQALARAAGATTVRAERPSEARQLFLGFESLAIAAAASADVTARPQILFRPTRLVVPAAVAPNFTIDDIKVGNKSQSVAAGSVPAEAFAQTAFNTPLKLDTCQISMDLILEVTNISAANADFRATMFGDAVY